MSRAINRQEIRRLLNEKRLSQRQIALQLGVSRETVRRIARGLDSGPGRSAPDGAARWPKRCPGCGLKVVLPCCRCRAETHAWPTSNDSPADASAMALYLRQEHQIRYQQVRRRYTTSGV